MFDKLKPEAAGLPPRITVTFDFDVNGILNVSAVDRGSGRQANQSFKAAHVQLTPAQKAEAHERVVSLTPSDAGVAALLARARQTLNATDQDLDRLSEAVAALEEAVNEGDEARQQELSEAIADILYELE